MESLGGREAEHAGARQDIVDISETVIDYDDSGLNVPIVDADTKEDRKKILVNYFTDNRNNHDFYAFKFFFCELLNFINVVGQIYFVDFFLGGEFTTYGSDVIAMSEMEQEYRVDPMARVFPKVNWISNKTALFS